MATSHFTMDGIKLDHIQQQKKYYPGKLSELK